MSILKLLKLKQYFLTASLLLSGVCFSQVIDSEELKLRDLNEKLELYHDEQEEQKTVSKSRGAQNCAEVEKNLELSKKKLDPLIPESYYSYGILLKQAGEGGCISDQESWKWVNAWHNAAVYGYFQAALQLGYYTQHNMYGIPKEYDKALSYYSEAVKIADKMNLTELQEKNGWGAAVMLCDLVVKEFPEGIKSEFVVNAYQKYMNHNKIENFLYTAKSDVLESHYYEVKGKAQHYGYFGEKIDLIKAYQNYENAGGNEAFDKMIELVDPDLAPNNTLTNAAYALYLYWLYLEYPGDIDQNKFDKLSYRFNELLHGIENRKNFSKLILKFPLFHKYNSKGEIDGLWNDFNQSKYKESIGYEGWGSLSEVKKEELFEKAIGSDDLEPETKCTIYMSMYRDGDKRALFPLAQAYYNGKGVKRNYSRARSLFEEDYKLTKNPESAEMFAYLNDEGLGGPQDWETAVEYYTYANTEKAKLELAEMYIFGLGGLNQDINNAKRILEDLAKNGNKKAIHYLDVLEKLDSQTRYSLTTSEGINLEVNLTEEETIPRFRKVSKGIGYNVHYDVPEGIGPIQIFPTQIGIRYSTYSPSGFYKGKGIHRVAVANKNKGYREIGYLVVKISGEGISANYLEIPTLTAWVIE